jgi:hypothetical protein
MVLLATSLLLCVAIFICYVRQPDPLAGVTAWPVWLWAVWALLLAPIGLSRATKRAFLGVCCVWLLCVGILAEEPRSMARRPRLSEREFEASRERAEAVRIVTLNCAGGDPTAAAEVADYDPDVVLLQESPGEKEVRSLADDLFGPDAAVVWGADTSVVARGAISTVSEQRDAHATVAQVDLVSGIRLGAVSLRLSPPVFRTDVWSMGYWRSHEANRRRHREEMAGIIEDMQALPADAPLVAGGDFNVPAGDAVTRLLRSRLHDAFRQGGVGWGSTVLNNYPVLRFDQVWISEPLRAVRVRAHRTKHSDHRLVVCDVAIVKDSRE